MRTAPLAEYSRLFHGSRSTLRSWSSFRRRHTRRLSIRTHPQGCRCGFAGQRYGLRGSRRRLWRPAHLRKLPGLQLRAVACRAGHSGRQGHLQSRFQRLRLIENPRPSQKKVRTGICEALVAPARPPLLQEAQRSAQRPRSRFRDRAGQKRVQRSRIVSPCWPTPKKRCRGSAT